MIPLNVMATTAYQKAIAWAHESGTRALTEACWPVSAAFAMQVHEEYGPLRVMLLKGSFYAERNPILKRKRFGVDHVWVQAMDDYENRLLYDLTIEQFKDGDQGPLIGVPVDTRAPARRFSADGWRKRKSYIPRVAPAWVRTIADADCSEIGRSPVLVIFGLHARTRQAGTCYAGLAHDKGRLTVSIVSLPYERIRPFFVLSGNILPIYILRAYSRDFLF